MKWFYLGLTAVVVLLCAGCMVGPDYVRPVVEQPLYFKSQPASAEAPLISKEWWQLYSDSDLDQLIAAATQCAVRKP